MEAAYLKVYGKDGTTITSAHEFHHENRLTDSEVCRGLRRRVPRVVRAAVLLNLAFLRLDEKSGRTQDVRPDDHVIPHVLSICDGDIHVELAAPMTIVAATTSRF